MAQVMIIDLPSTHWSGWSPLPARPDDTNLLAILSFLLALACLVLLVAMSAGFTLATASGFAIGPALFALVIASKCFYTEVLLWLIS